MSVRHLMHGLLSANAGITAVYGDRIIDEGNLGEEKGTQPEFPYLVTKYGEETPGASRTSRVQILELWSYDHPQDYTRTDKGLAVAYGLLHELGGVYADVTGEPRTYLVEALWESTSRGLTDDVLRASVRYATYKLVTNTP